MRKSFAKLGMPLGCLLFLAVTLGVPAAAAEAPLTQTEKLEIRHYPGDLAIELGIKGAGTPASINSVILHNIAVVNGNGSPTEIASLSLSLSRDGEVFQTSIFTAEDVASAARASDKAKASSKAMTPSSGQANLCRESSWRKLLFLAPGKDCC